MDTKYLVEPKDFIPLTDEETKNARTVLEKKNLLEFRVQEKRYKDPELNGQKIALITFIPAKDAKPNDKGVYGYAKIRGTFSNDEEASERAELIIKRHDSYHIIHHVPVGAPFPLSLREDFCRETNIVDMKKQMASDLSEDIKAKRKKEQEEIEEIKEREKRLLEDVKEEKTPDELDDYIVLLTKRAQLTWTYLDTLKKMKLMVSSIVSTRKKINDVEKEKPEFKQVALEKYKKSREEVGITDENIEETFMKYLVMDADIPEIDQEYQKTFPS